MALKYGYSCMANVREKLYRIIFEAETPAGRAFDIALLLLILTSVIVVALESVAELRVQFGALFFTLEWCFTLLFTVEYFLRVYSSPKPLKYMFSFFGIVDLVSIIPTYLSLFVLGAQYFLVVRVLRLLRIARIFKLTRFINEGQVLTKALRASVTKIAVFFRHRAYAYSYNRLADVHYRRGSQWVYKHT